MEISGGSPLKEGNGRRRIREGKERVPPGYFVQGPPVLVTPLYNALSVYEVA